MGAGTGVCGQLGNAGIPADSQFCALRQGVLGSLAPRCGEVPCSKPRDQGLGTRGAGRWSLVHGDSMGGSLGSGWCRGGQLHAQRG